MAIISYVKSVTCLGFIHTQGEFMFQKGGVTTYTLLGKPKVVSTQQDETKVAFMMATKQNPMWHIVSYHNDTVLPAAKAITDAKENDNPVCIIANNKQTGVSPAGEETVCYNGIRVYEAPCNQGGSYLDTIITIGPYQNNPVRLGDLLTNSPGRESNTLLWMQYVAEEWLPQNCENMEELLKQKTAIQKYLADRKTA